VEHGLLFEKRLHLARKLPPTRGITFHNAIVDELVEK
jgi:hypothetical protein